MGFGKRSSRAPSPDPRIGEAALLSAETGQDYLRFMEEQAAITNEWAEADRERYLTVFQPLQDAYIEEAMAGPDYDAVAGDVRRSRADVRNSFDQARQQEARQLAAMGVRPGSGRSLAAKNRTSTNQALADAGAANTTRLSSRRAAEARSDAARANAINMGSGMAVNPATSMGLANGAMSAGFQGAMRGYGQQGQLLNTQYQQQLQSWQANQAQQNSMWGGIGSIAGLGISMLSSKDAKTDKQPAHGVLEAINQMPVEKWRYKDGMGDSGASEHVGPYAEDFAEATGVGDGKTIPIPDLLGMTVGAVQELSKKVDQLMQPRGIKEAMA